MAVVLNPVFPPTNEQTCTVLHGHHMPSKELAGVIIARGSDGRVMGIMASPQSLALSGHPDVGDVADGAIAAVLAGF